MNCTALAEEPIGAAHEIFCIIKFSKHLKNADIYFIVCQKKWYVRVAFL